MHKHKQHGAQEQQEQAASQHSTAIMIRGLSKSIEPTDKGTIKFWLANTAEIDEDAIKGVHFNFHKDTKEFMHSAKVFLSTPADAKKCVENAHNKILKNKAVRVELSAPPKLLASYDAKFASPPKSKNTKEYSSTVSSIASMKTEMGAERKLFKYMVAQFFLLKRVGKGKFRKGWPETAHLNKKMVQRVTEDCFFEIDEHQKRFALQFKFHRKNAILSVHDLPKEKQKDVALVMKILEQQERKRVESSHFRLRSKFVSVTSFYTKAWKELQFEATSADFFDLEGQVLFIELGCAAQILRKLNHNEHVEDSHFELVNNEWVQSIDSFTDDESVSNCHTIAIYFTSEQAEVLQELRNKLADFLPGTKENSETITLIEQYKMPIPTIKPHSFPFELQYMLECIVSHNFWPREMLDQQFYDFLAKEPLPRAMEALKQIFHGFKNVSLELEAPLEALKKRLAKLPKKTVVVAPPMGSIPVRRIVITPTRTICFLPEMDESNRVIRQYEQFADDFVRVSFANESLNFIGFEEYSNEDVIKLRVKHVLQDGIRVAGKHFHLLSLSQSQMREHSAWFYAQRFQLTADNIRSWMGNFSNIKNPAKYLARMGQCFSRTKLAFTTEKEDAPNFDKFIAEEDEFFTNKPAQKVKALVKTRRVPYRVLPSERKQIEDIWDPDDKETKTKKPKPKKFNFTDGVGLISQKFLDELKYAIFSKAKFIPMGSAVQVRYAGIKGVFSLEPKLESHLKIAFRESQKKFDSEHTDFEIIEFARTMPCHLNRQVITLLQALGVSDKVFEDLHGQAMEDHTNMLKDADTALKVIEKQYRDIEIFSVVHDIIKNGMFRDPFVQSVLQATRMRSFKDLKDKTRVFVEQGAILMGVADEYQLLEEGQVFIQSSATNVIPTKVLEGTIVITKNPCFHPGDIRVLEAVDMPQLHHHVDVVVFPTVGKRPHFNECSGSDLDGDLYFVSWDDRLRPPRTEVPMDYTGATPATVEVTMQHVVDFFIKYMQHDQLGIIANAHLAQSDMHKDGAMSSNCLQLAKLHSDAVDFAKTGQHPKLSNDLKAHQMPDFMQNNHKPHYKSDKVIGRMFRSIPDVEPYLLGPVSVEKELVVSGFEQHLPKANEHLAQYVSEMTRILNQFSVNTEAEALSGNVHAKYLKKKVFELRVELANEIKFCWRKFEKLYQDWVQALEEEDKMKAASAYYVATYTAAEHARIGKTTVFLGFCWVASNELLKIRAKNAATQASSPKSPVTPTTPTLIPEKKKDTKVVKIPLKKPGTAKKQQVVSPVPPSTPTTTTTTTIESQESISPILTPRSATPTKSTTKSTATFKTKTTKPQEATSPISTPRAITPTKSITNTTTTTTKPQEATTPISTPRAVTPTKSTTKSTTTPTATKLPEIDPNSAWTNGASHDDFY